MFGTLRLCLAALVILEHMGRAPMGLLTGISAVCVFFMISGYAMAGLYGTAYRGNPAGFYADRVIRLAPQYYVYLALTLFVYCGFGWHDPPGPAPQPSLLNLLSAATVLPLILWMVIPNLRVAFINPPTWSLGVEGLFYLTLPWMLGRKHVMWGVLAAGAIAWTLATQGVINNDYFGYRLPPAAFICFLAGVALKRRDWLMYGSIAAFFLISAVVICLCGKLHLGYNFPLIVGPLFGLPVLPILARFRRRPWDDFLGAGSYGTYLAQWIFVAALGRHIGEWWAVATAIAASIACGFASYWLVERPTVRLRRARRRIAGTKKGATPEGVAHV